MSFFKFDKKLYIIFAVDNSIIELEYIYTSNNKKRNFKYKQNRVNIYKNLYISH